MLSCVNPAHFMTLYVTSLTSRHLFHSFSHFYTFSPKMEQPLDLSSTSSKKQVSSFHFYVFQLKSKTQYLNLYTNLIT